MRDAIAEKLTTLAREALEVAEKQVPANIDPHEPLTDAMDSVAVNALIGFIEDEWDIEIDDEDINPARFETLYALAGLVETKVNQT